MKKFLATILAFVYLTSSFGATVHFHYCMGKLISWGLINNQSAKACMFCNMPKDTGNGYNEVSKKGCCQDEQEQVKTDKDQKMVPSDFEFSKFSPDTTAIHYPSPQDIRLSSYLLAYPTANAPPKRRNLAVFLLNRNFRI